MRIKPYTVETMPLGQVKIDEKYDWSTYGGMNVYIDSHTSVPMP